MRSSKDLDPIVGNVAAEITPNGLSNALIVSKIAKKIEKSLF